MHTIYFDNSNGYELHSLNIWYWLNEKEIDKKHGDMETEEDRQYTKKIIKYIKEVQKILDKNKISNTIEVIKLIIIYCQRKKLKNYRLHLMVFFCIKKNIIFIIIIGGKYEKRKL